MICVRWLAPTITRLRIRSGRQRHGRMVLSSGTGNCWRDMARLCGCLDCRPSNWRPIRFGRLSSNASTSARSGLCGGHRYDAVGSADGGYARRSYFDRAGREVSEDEALDEHGVLKDGHRMRVPLMMRDGAASYEKQPTFVDAYGRSIADPMARGSAGARFYSTD